MLIGKPKKCTDGNDEHKFEARYDSWFPGFYRIGSASLECLKALRTEKYVRDVCVRCGKTVDRKE